MSEKSSRCERCEQYECICLVGESILKENDEIERLTAQLKEMQTKLERLQKEEMKPKSNAISKDTVLKNMTKYNGRKEEFPHWCERTRALLSNAGLAEYMTEVERKDDENNWSGRLVNNTEDNAFIYNLLILSIPPAVASGYKRAQLGPYKQHGMKAYHLLRKTELGCNEVNVMALETRYTGRKLQSNETMDKYVEDQRDCFTKLEQLNAGLSETKQVIALLKGLPKNDEYDRVRAEFIMKHRNNVDECCEALILHESLKVAIRNETQRATRPQRRIACHVDNIECWNCRKRGHYARNCPEEENNLQPSHSRQTQNERENNATEDTPPNRETIRQTRPPGRGGRRGNRNYRGRGRGGRQRGGTQAQNQSAYHVTKTSDEGTTDSSRQNQIDSGQCEKREEQTDRGLRGNIDTCGVKPLDDNNESVDMNVPGKSIRDHQRVYAEYIAWHLAPMHRAYVVKKLYPSKRMKFSSEQVMFASSDIYSWAIDTAASINLTNDLSWFKTSENVRVPIRGAESSTFLATKVGTIVLQVLDRHGVTKELEIENVHYSPAVHCNILSASLLSKGGCDMRILERILITPNGTVIPLLVRDDIYVIETMNVQHNAMHTQAIDESSASILTMSKNKRKKVLATYAGVLFNDETILKWHRRLCHIDFDKLQRTLKFKHKGKAWPKCHVCSRAKNRRTAYQKIAELHDETEPLQRVVSDLQGPYRVEGIGGVRYTHNFVDVYSHYLTILMHERKSDAPENLRAFSEKFDPPLVIKTDKGGEFTGAKWMEACRAYNIEHEIVNTAEPNQVARAERAWGWVGNLVRAAMIDSQLPYRFWPLAIHHGVYIYNRTALKALEWKTPYESFYNRAPRSLKRCHPFGCVAYVHINKKNRNNKYLGPRGNVGIYVGENDKGKGSMFLMPAFENGTLQGEIITSRNADYHEDKNIVDIMFDIPGARQPDNSYKTFDDSDDMLIFNDIEDEIPDRRQRERPIHINIEDSDKEDEEESEVNDDVQMFLDENGHVRFRNQDGEDITTEPGSEPVQSEANEDQEYLDTIISGLNRNYVPNSENPLSRTEYFKSQPITAIMEENIIPNARLRDGTSYEVNFMQMRDGRSFNMYADSNISTAEESVFITEAERPKHEAEPNKLPDLFKGYKTASKRPDWPMWKEAIRTELNNLIKFNTFKGWRTKQKGIQDAHPLGTVWVFKIKRNPNGTIRKYKARLCVQGFTQEYGIDYTDTYAPVVRANTTRAMLAIGSKLGLDVYQMDIVNAYVQAPVKEKLVIRPPPGIELITEGELGHLSGSNLFQLLRSLYGLKQAGKNWNDLLTAFLESLGFIRSQYDPCLFFGNNEHEATHNILMIVVYVDDLLSLTDLIGYESLLRRIQAKFEVTPMGLAEYFLGVEIIREDGMIKLSQRSMIRDILERYAMDKSNGNSLPMNKSAQEEVVKRAHDELTDIPLYRSIVGSFQYLAVWTRADIAFYVGFLSRFLVDPRAIHMQLVKRLLRYLKATQNAKLTYKVGKKGRNAIQMTPDNKRPILVGYTDSDWAEDKIMRRSISGYVFLLNDELIAWKSKSQDCVTRSVFEAEYVALVEATAEGKLLCGLVSEIASMIEGRELSGIIMMYADSESSIKFAKNPTLRQRSKHIDVRYHWIKEAVASGFLWLRHVSTQFNLADFLTKFLTGPSFWKQIVRVMQITCELQPNTIRDAEEVEDGEIEG